jgi:hypothetical protein
VADEPPNFDVQVRLVHREHWRRIPILTGEVDATLIYNAMEHGERVYLDGRCIAQSSVWSWRTVYPWIEFRLPTDKDDTLAARIDVAATLIPWRMRITYFRLSIEGKMLYDELDGEYWFHDDSGRVTNEPYEPNT